MAPAHLLASYLVFALLQHGNAEISSNSAGANAWFAANVIDDQTFSPKPLTDIFTTGSPFSPTNPIIVLSSTVTNQPFPTSTFSSTPLSSTTAQNLFSTPQNLFSSSQNPFSSSQDPFSSTQGPLSTSQSPISTSEGPISTSQVSFTTSQDPSPTAAQMTSQQTNPTNPPVPIVAVAPNPNGTQPQQNFFYIYQQMPQQVQNTAQPATDSTTPAPCATSPLTSTDGSSTLAPLAPFNSTNSTLPFPSIRIRMLSPRGTVTNVNIGGSSTVRSTTTRRNRRRNRNNYDDCVDACTGRRMPICAAPLNVRPINPDTLKGFPSICHMACNNSFRRNIYEKVADGRCGRLRTRIRTMDANDRLTRAQLNRLQYTIIPNQGPVIEISPLNN